MSSRLLGVLPRRPDCRTRRGGADSPCPPGTAPSRRAPFDWCLRFPRRRWELPHLRRSSFGVSESGSSAAIPLRERRGRDRRTARYLSTQSRSRPSTRTACRGGLLAPWSNRAPAWIDRRCFFGRGSSRQGRADRLADPLRASAAHDRRLVLGLRLDIQSRSYLLGRKSPAPVESEVEKPANTIGRNARMRPLDGGDQFE